MNTGLCRCVTTSLSEAPKDRAGYIDGMFPCSHHVSWIEERPHGEFLCIECGRMVTRNDIYPKLEELGPDFQAHWEAHEKEGKTAGTPLIRAV